MFGTTGFRVGKGLIYIGMTDSIERRIEQHQNGYSKSTAPYGSFCLLFTEDYPYTFTARNREKYLKATSGKRILGSTNKWLE